MLYRFVAYGTHRVSKETITGRSKVSCAVPAHIRLTAAGLPKLDVEAVAIPVE